MEPASQGLTGSLTLIKRVATSRWMVLIATFFILACSGAAYNFGLYSQEIKLSLHYNQKSINTIGFFKDLGSNLGIFSGLLYDATGPRVVLISAALLNMFGYLMIWLAVTKRMSSTKLWQVCLYMCVGANSQAFSITAAMVTSVKNFPNNRGLVIGLLRGYVGLSGAILTLFYEAVYGNQPASFILLIAWLPSLVCLLFMLVIRRLPPSRPEHSAAEQKIGKILLIMASVLAGYLMIIIIVQHLEGVKVPRSAFQALAAFMVLIVMSPLAIVIKEEFNKLKKGERNSNEEHDEPGELHQDEPNGSMVELQLVGVEAADGQSTHEAARKFSVQWATLKRLAWEKPPRGSDFNILQAVLSIDMLIIFVSTACGAGAGFMAVNNLAQIGTALNYNPGQVSSFVSLISIWNFLGRVSSGFISEMALQRYAIPRTLFLALVMAIAAIAYSILALNPAGALLTSSILIGFTIGAQWTLMFIIMSEIFGLKYYGTLLNVGCIATPLGSYLLSVRVAGSLYDIEAAKQERHKSMGKILVRMLLDSPSSKSGELLCHGPHCYRDAFFIMAAVCAFGCFVVLILTARTWRFYKRLHLTMKLQ